MANQGKKTDELKPTGRFPTKGRQPAHENYVSASLNPRQTPELFGGVSTD